METELPVLQFRIDLVTALSWVAWMASHWSIACTGSIGAAPRTNLRELGDFGRQSEPNYRATTSVQNAQNKQMFRQELGLSLTSNRVIRCGLR